MVLEVGPRIVVRPAEPQFVAPRATPRFEVLRVALRRAVRTGLRFAVLRAQRPCAVLTAEQPMCVVSGRGCALPITAPSSRVWRLAQSSSPRPYRRRQHLSYAGSGPAKRKIRVIGIIAADSSDELLGGSVEEL